MSNYTKTTNFATKDALASGNPAKIVKGTEIDTEFNNIAVASSTKANKADPVFTGTATLPVTNASSLSIGGDGVTVTGIKMKTTWQATAPLSSLHNNQLKPTSLASNRTGLGCN